MLRKVLTLLAIFVVFYLGAHFYIRWKNRVEVDTIKTSKLIDCEPNQVRTIRIQQSANGKDESMVFARADEPQAGVPPAAQLARAIWQLDNEKKAEADASLLNRIASQLCEIYDPIPQRAEDFKPVNPEFRGRKVELNLGANGKSDVHSIEFGTVGPDRQNVVRYLSAKGERVVKISPQLLELVSLAPNKYVSSRVLRMKADDIQQITAVIDGKERFSLERNGADWRLTVNGKEAKGHEDPVHYVNRLSTLLAMEVKPGKASDCTAKPHKVSLQLLGLGGRKETAAFDYGKSGMIAACDSARDAAFAVHRDMLKYLDLTSGMKWLH